MSEMDRSEVYTQSQLEGSTADLGSVKDGEPERGRKVAVGQQHGRVS